MNQHPPRSELRITRLSTGYRNHLVVEDLTLPPFATGQVVALVGPNAAGKSTLLRALAGLLPATGSIKLNDENLLSLSLAERTARVGFMPQALPHGVALSVLESVIGALKAAPFRNQRMAARHTHERALQVLERVGIAELALEPLDHLSGGQRQLASLAQTLVRAPTLLLLDEPTSALDLHHQVTVMQLTRRLAADGHLVILVLHDLNLAARWADQVVVLHEGRLFASGTPEEAITPEMLAEVYGVAARIERCSWHCLQVMADDTLAQRFQPASP